MKKLYYANVKKIIAGSKTNVGNDVIEEGLTRFGKNLVIGISDFEKQSQSLNENKDIFENTSKYNEDFYLIDEGKEDIDVFALKDELNKKNIETKYLKPAYEWSELKKNDDGLIPVIVTDYKNDKILMMAYMNEEAYYNTFKTGLMTYYSRSRKEQWVKGETSGHFQYIKSMKADCDLDTLLCSVSQVGVPCHTGKDTCFFNDVLKNDSIEKNPSKILTDLYKVIEDRKVNPKEGSYTNYLFDKGLDKILKKVGEEACEIVIASKNEEAKEIKYEIADFLYHLSVLMVEKNVTWEEVAEELSNR
ncbi:MAG: bifunctional phosphoribosyl-AMP cyclohydrolase/phosphoribosyl-ATP diphosphatase HisIE [Lachnospiraceae bacterium]|nr:bifunctional phosphoribosyl-AMP cyclohydrolase/phosphoribosyl-ATP diphosphatase HisIE [Lachnospiraceae bacterium]